MQSPATDSSPTSSAGFLLVLNPGSGSADDPRELHREVASRLPGVRAVHLPHEDLAGAIGDAVSEGLVVVAAGGDGTVNAVAQHVVGRGTMGVLPAGTLNHFAGDLGLEDVNTAIDALEAGAVRAIDVGRIGDHYFVNNAGIGMYPELVYERERSEERVGKWLASAGAALRVLRQTEPVVGTIEADGDARALFAWMVFFGNNRFGSTPARLAHRARMDEGVLDVGLFLAGPQGARRSSVAWRVLRSRPWQTSSRVVRRTARQVRVRLEGEPRHLSRDGETGDPVREIEAEIVPGALRVVAPPEDRASSDR